MTEIERAMPPLNADERTTLEAWLDFYRATLAMKCEGMDDVELSTASVEPSPLTLLGLVQHMAEVERNWFRRVLAGEDAPPIYGSTVRASGHDGGFDLSEQSTFAAAQAVWRTEITQARANCATRDLTDTAAFNGGEVSLRWIYLHMIGEYARHCGQADLIRERIDGATGV
ncbi:DinB family protein [Mycobacterium sp. IS-3022]|uniref:DinB family protein n=1 Tax=Mycobacterium sp. IS-3022 TaxID=1772277 RepID=UPI0007417225|nr:DinB family protein [Mycobacterium sp. IS-3022]KUH98129.1 Mini-circle protein [Mycobacterium sp. IS-3022]